MLTREGNLWLKRYGHKRMLQGKLFYTSDCIFIFVIYSHLFPMCWSCICDQEGIMKLEMGCIYCCLYNGHSMVAVIYGVSDWEIVYWLARPILCMIYLKFN